MSTASKAFDLDPAQQLTMELYDARLETKHLGFDMPSKKGTELYHGYSLRRIPRENLSAI